MREAKNFGKGFLAVLCLVALVACDSPEEKYTRYMDRGNKLFTKAEYAKARLEYRNAARLKPADADVRYRLGLVSEAEGDLRNAFAAFLAAEQQDPRHKDARTKLAQYFVAAEQKEEAKKRIQSLLTETPSDAEAHALTAALLSRDNAFDAAEEEARVALAANPLNITAYSVLASLYANKGDLAKAQQTIEEAVQKIPDSIALRLLQARVYDKADKLDKIVEVYDALFKLRPDDISLRADLAQALNKAGRRDQAEGVLRAGVSTLPRDARMKQAYIGFLSENAGLEAAEAAIKAYLAQEPGNETYYMWLADLYASHKAADRAIELLQKLVSQGGADEGLALGARTSLAKLQILNGRVDLAESLVATVLEKKPGDKNALLLRGRLQFEKGAYQEAVATMRLIVRDDPRARDALQILAEALLRQGYADLAVDTLNQLVDADPSQMGPRVRLAQIYGVQGNRRHALEILDEVVKADPAYPIGWESVARIALDMGDGARAEAAIQKLTSFDGYDKSARFLEGRLAALKGKPDKAIAKFGAVIEADPAAPIVEHALPALIETYRRAKRMDEAVQYLGKLPTNVPFIAYVLGQAQASLDHAPEAAAAFDRSVEAGASFQDPYIARAHLWVLQNKLEEAIELLARAEKIAPSDTRAAMVRADLLGRVGRANDSIALYEKILTQNPNLDVAANNMAQMIADTMPGDRAAMQKARRAAERFANSSQPAFLDTLGWIYFLMDDTAMAQTMFERVLAASGAVPSVFHYHYGRLFEKLGQKDLARAQFDKALAGELDKSVREEVVRRQALLSK